MKALKTYRQGDVLLVGVRGRAPGKVQQARGGTFVLVHGEVTGNDHAIEAAHVVVRLAEGVFYLHVKKASQLKHNEHATIMVQPGTYRVVRQREYTPEEIRNVQD